jgi:demethylspheroidene O-methyltransferase
MSAAETGALAAPIVERLKGWRRRLIANPAFQRWAASFPLTRRVAERNAGALFDLCAGFVYSQILAACVRLDLFARLAEGPRSTRALALEMGLSTEGAERLLRAAAALKLVEPTRGSGYALADLGAALVGNPAIAAFVEHHALLYDDLRDPVALLRRETTARIARFWSYSGERYGDAPASADEAAYAQYCDLMSRSQALIAEDALDACPPRGRRVWLDVGGGEGAFLSAVAARAPKIELMLFDLPQVATRARLAIEKRGLAGRARVFDGDFLVDALPQGADIVSLVRVVHDHDDDAAAVLLRRVHAALPPGGTVLIAEPMASISGAERVGDAYFGFYLLAMGRGRARRPDELIALLRAAGFTDARAPKTRRPMLTSVITASRV